MKFLGTVLVAVSLFAPISAMAKDFPETNYTRVDASLGELLRSGYTVAATFVDGHRIRYVLQKEASTIQCTIYFPDAYGKTGNVKTKTGVPARSRCASLTD